jgi:2'-5' RNA ligase
MKSVISIWLQPSPKLKKEIFGIIKDFSKKYKVYSDLKSYKGPHITILEIHSGKHDFKTVVNVVKDISVKFKPFDLGINGIGYFRKLDESGKRNFVIYLKVEKNEELFALKDLVDNEFSNESARHEDRGFVPHITITHRELDRKNFYRALKEYKNLDFVRTFVVDGIMVSKRNTKTKKVTIKHTTFRKKHN